MVEPVVIGKNIIEILTTGMYENPLVIYREYIQNAVDSINQAVEVELFNDIREGEIDIEIYPEKKKVSFCDNALGIEANKSWGILTSVAASGKDRNKHLGFRGIGRLAGLAYCAKLIIETSYFGEEVKTQLSWDGEKLRSIISNQKDKRPADEVIESITTFRDDLAEEEDKHYFRVELINVKNIKLLDIPNVEKYLRMVAPVPYPNFIYRNKIIDGLRDRGAEFGEYRVFVNTSEIYKPYKANIYQKEKRGDKQIDEVVDIQFFEATVEDELLAVGWYSVTKNMQLIPVHNEPAGLRIRKGNIQIGNQSTFQRFFTEERFHKYFVGEVHIVSKELLPNGQRDYFDESEILTAFEEQMFKLANKLKRLCRDVSELNSATKKIESFQKKKKEFLDKEQNEEFLSPDHESDERENLEKAKDVARKGEEIFAKIEKRAEDDEILRRIVKYRRDGINTEEAEAQIDENQNGNGCKKKKYKSNKLNKLNKKEQKLIGDIYDIIRTVLSPDLADNLIYKIEEKFGGRKTCKP